MTDTFKKKIPNYLTYLRILAIPFVVASFYFEQRYWTIIGFFLFILASITDYFDGYLARKFKSTSTIGKMLDPIADKLLVAATLLMLAGFGKLGGYGLIAAVVILLRELLVSGLREYLSAIQIGLPVTRLAKWKTGFQMCAIPLLIIADITPEAWHIFDVGLYSLCVAACLTIITGYDYLRIGLKHLD